MSHHKPSSVYHSRFKEWDKQSWVRSGIRQNTPFDPEKDFFPETLTAVFSHPEVQHVDPATRRDILVLYLYNYLEFTVWLETGPVNDVCEMLRRPGFLDWLPVKMKDDALKIYVDEGGHAEMSHSLIRLVEEHTRVKSLKLEPEFVGVLDRIAAREEHTYQPLIKLFFVIVSETLITGSLTKLPKDENVQQAVRDLARDHAMDEGRHHAYFKELFQILWPRLPQPIKWKVQLWLPDMLLGFLKPGERGLLQILEQFPSQFPVPGRIVSEILSQESLMTSIQESARPTLTMFKANGLFNDSGFVDILRAKRLLPHHFEVGT
ncbi:MAG: diiron oxygenase [Terriglobales bacterium]